MKQNTLVFLCALVVCAVACAPMEDELPKEAVYSSFTSFVLSKQHNEGAILADIEPTIEQGKIEIASAALLHRDNLVVSFTTDGVGVYVDDVEQVSGVTANDFTSPVTYKVISPTGHTSEWVVSLENTGLAVVEIKTPNSRLIPPKTEDWLENTQMRITLADGTTEFDDEINIRGRGNSTWTFPKKPYAIKLNDKTSILGMPKHKRWVLLANWLDKTSLRNHISFHIARQTGLEWTPRGEFVEVFINGKHKGCYYLCEQIKVDENRVNIADLSDDDPSGGYLMELDVYFDEAYKFYSPRAGMPYMFKDPDEVSTVQEEYMYGYVSAMEEVLYDDERLLAGEYASYLDIDSFIDWWFVHELTGNSEPMHPKSTYMHKDRGGLLKAGPVWDFDWETFVPYKVSGFLVRDAVYYGRLFADEEFVVRVKERWAMLKPRFDTVAAFIDSESARIASSVEVNNRMWPIDVVVNQDEKLSYEEAVARMKRSYESRLLWLDSKITNM